MGGGHSVVNITNNVFKSISETMINSIQSQQSDLNTIQALIINCSKSPDPNVLPSDVKPRISPEEAYNQCVLSMGKGRTAEEIRNICDPLLSPCVIQGVTQKQTIAVRIEGKQYSQISNDVMNDIKQNIEQTAKQQNNGVQFNNSTKQKLDTLVELVQKNSMDILNTMNSTITPQQIIDINAQGRQLTLQNVVQETAINFITQILQNNTQINKAVTELSQDIKQDADQQSSLFSGVFGILITIIVVIVIILGSIGIILWLIKRSKKSPELVSTEYESMDARDAKKVLGPATEGKSKVKSDGKEIQWEQSAKKSSSVKSRKGGSLFGDDEAGPSSVTFEDAISERARK